VTDVFSSSSYRAQLDRERLGVGSLKDFVDDEDDECVAPMSSKVHVPRPIEVKKAKKRNGKK